MGSGWVRVAALWSRAGRGVGDRYSDSRCEVISRLIALEENYIVAEALAPRFVL